MTWTHRTAALGTHGRNTVIMSTVVSGHQRSVSQLYTGQHSIVGAQPLRHQHIRGTAPYIAQHSIAVPTTTSRKSSWILIFCVGFFRFSGKILKSRRKNQKNEKTKNSKHCTALLCCAVLIQNKGAVPLMLYQCRAVPYTMVTCTATVLPLYGDLC